MQIYLPIAELPVNVLLILFMGLAVGVISGMFGIGGGFLMTPLLIFIGITPAVAVASVASHVAASSFSGAISYWRRRALDPILAAMLIAAGLIGTTAGVMLFTLLRRLGQLDLFISLLYVVLLGTVGGLMLVESVNALRATRSDYLDNADGLAARRRNDVRMNTEVRRVKEQKPKARKKSRR